MFVPVIFSFHISGYFFILFCLSYSNGCFTQRYQYYFKHFHFLRGFYYQDFENNNFYRLGILILWILFSLLVIVNSIDNGSEFALKMSGAKIYLYLADSYAMTTFLVLNSHRKGISIFLVTLISFVCIFALLSRTTLYLFTIIMLTYLFFNRRKLFCYIIIPLIVVIIFEILRNGEYLTTLGQNRMTSFIITGDDNSWYDRKVIFDKELTALRHNWFLGDFLVKS